MLGHVLFIIFVSSVCRIFNFRNIHGYVDDVVLVVTQFLNGRKMLQNNFVALVKWDHDKGRVIDTMKTVLMRMSLRNKILVSYATDAYVYIQIQKPY